MLVVVKKINIFKQCKTFPNKKVNQKKIEKSFGFLETPNAAPKTDISFIPSTVQCECACVRDVRVCLLCVCACAALRCLTTLTARILMLFLLSKTSFSVVVLSLLLCCCCRLGLKFILPYAS